MAMREKSSEVIHHELILGGLFVILGAAALLGETSTALAETIVRMWPAGLIAMGVALLFKPEVGK